MENTRVITFDFFGVWVNNFPSQTGEALLDKFSIRKDEWDVFIKNAADGLDTGEKEERQFIENIVNFFKLQCSPEELSRTIEDLDSQFLKVNKNLITIVTKLKEKYTIACFSNVSKSLQARMDKLDLYDVFDRTFFSYEIGKTKSDAGAWEYVEKELSLRLEEGLFIDDSAHNIKVAEERGWQAMRYKNDGEVEKRLKELL